ncbi:hypothetical protein [Flavobacterium pedocola]
MKAFFIFPLLLCLGCTATKEKVADSPNEVVLASLRSSCPEDGKCGLKIKKNKRLEVSVDGTGKLYYKTVDDPSKSVVLFEYAQTAPEDLQDAGYREEILFEIDNKADKLSLTDKDLGNVKMLFGRHCFCKGQAGYFYVKKGKLDLKKEKGKLYFTLDFVITDVPQIINSISVE